MDRLQRDIFRRGSRTYYHSTIFFPARIRRDVSTLYAFVRSADNFVDTTPQQHQALHDYITCYRREWRGVRSGHPLITPFVALMRRRQFAPEWIEAFFDSMQLDRTKCTYQTLSETLHYIYGSAEVVGLCMAQIMELSPAAADAARMLGRAMQYINFLRDIDEDNQLGRTYLPLDETTLTTLKEEECRRSATEFRRYIARQIERYREWKTTAESGYRFISHGCLVPIRAAAELYDWTARRIACDPFIVFRRKVKPARLHILSSVLLSGLRR